MRKRPWINCHIIDEGTPLTLFLFIRRKRRRERIGRLGRNRRLASRERRCDRPRKFVIIEAEGSAEYPDVVQVLHPAVRASQCHHRLELLGNDGLSRVGTQPWRGEVEHDRIVDDFSSGLQRIAETDIDRQVESGAYNGGDGA